MTWLRHWLVPSEHNDFHPHSLRWPFLVYLAALIIFTQLIWNIAVTGKASVLGFATDINVTRVVELTNKERADQGLSALKFNPVLTLAAQAKANDMLVNHYWAHVSPTGETPWSFIHAAGYQYDYAGENLAMDFNTSGGVVAGWMASPDHRANVLDTHYQDVGVAVANGQLNGKDTTLVVAMYAAPQTSLVDSAINTLIPGAKAAASAPTESAPASQSFSLLRPLSFISTMNWAEIATVGLLAAVVLIYLNDHRVKLKLSVAPHHHSHSLLQAALLITAIVLILVKVSHGLVG